MAKEERRVTLPILFAFIFLISALPVPQAVEFNFESPSVQPQQPSIINQTSYPNSAGFTFTNTTYDSITGITTIERPIIPWSLTNGMGLTTPRTAACSVYDDQSNQVYLMGGLIDPDPLQSGDETSTTLIEIFDVANGTWDPAPNSMPYAQQYHDCVKIGTKIYVIGDYFPHANPEIKSTGTVQILDLLTDNWSNGTNMPNSKGVGLAGSTEHNGYLYVAGGISNRIRSDPTDRLMRYDPVNDVWSEMANMSHKRFAFDLVPFRGKLIAYGGMVQYFDAATNETVIGTSNITEAYDPATNSWSRLPNATQLWASYASAVINDEIIIIGGYSGTGWAAVKNGKTLGYDPMTNSWRTHNNLQIDMFESTMVNANGTLVYAGGESTNTPYSAWSLQFLADTEMYENPDQLEGWFTSPSIDLRHGDKGSASGLWLDFSAYEPSGTTLGLQYRMATSSNGLAQANWLPTTQPVNDFYQQSNLSLQSSIEDLPFLQYRVQLTSHQLGDWIMPRLNYVSIGADEVSFGENIPHSMQPSSAPVTVQTHHHSPTKGADYWIAIREADQNGIYSPGSSWSTLNYNTSTESLTIDDIDQLFMTEQVSVVVNSSDDQGEFIDWQFSLSKDVQADYLVYQIGTYGQRNTSYISPDLISLDKEVQIDIVNITSSYSSTGDAVLEEGEVIPSTSEIQIEIDRLFKNSGLRMLEGEIEGRLHIDVQTFDEDELTSERLWDNVSTEWFDLPASDSYLFTVGLAEGISGEAHLWFEARTDEDWTLDVDEGNLEFFINAEYPLLLSTYPEPNAYTNEDAMRTAGIELYDVGGFSNESISAFIWIEALHDGTQGGSLDAYPQSVEFVPTSYSIASSENMWYLNTTVNDTINDDHQYVHVFFEGQDVAGWELAPPENGLSHLQWETREPSFTELQFFDITSETISSAALLEPSREVSFEMNVYDANTISDISKVTIEFGGDDQLGIVYEPKTSSCSSLDVRLLVHQDDCVVSVEDEVMNLQLSATVGWSFSMAGLINGKLDVIIRDADGANRTEFENKWLLQREMNIELYGLRDVDGPVENDIEEGVIVMAQDHLKFEGELTHATSLVPYNGTVKLRWDGNIQLDRWTGGADVDVLDGAIQYLIPTPLRSGLIYDVQISVWDPLETTQLAVYDVDDFIVDANPPEILTPNLNIVVSRYALDAVEVGVNIDEPQGWSGQLELTCQIRSNDVTWEPITQIGNSTMIYEDKTMFTFLFNFSSQGDPSLLSAQASLACWANGSDDAGWDLVSSAGNSMNTPWLLKSLSNKGPNLAIEGIAWKDELVPGEDALLELRFYNTGEDIDSPFQVSIYTVVEGTQTLAKKSNVGELNADVVSKINAYVLIPEGKWELLIVVDSSNAIWELDENDNNLTKSYDTEASMFGAVLLGVSGSIVILGLLGLLIFRKRATHEDLSQLDMLEKESLSVDETPTPGQEVVQSAPKKRVGPPRKGPPPSKPKTQSPQEAAQSHFSALDSLVADSSETMSEKTFAKDYSDLPGGGEYKYTTEGTFYEGESCGRWILNDDQSFSKVE